MIGDSATINRVLVISSWFHLKHVSLLDDSSLPLSSSDQSSRMPEIAPWHTHTDWHYIVTYIRVIMLIYTMMKWVSNGSRILNQGYQCSHRSDCFNYLLILLNLPSPHPTLFTNPFECVLNSFELIHVHHDLSFTSDDFAFTCEELRDLHNCYDFCSFFTCDPMFCGPIFFTTTRLSQSHSSLHNTTFYHYWSHQLHRVLWVISIFQFCSIIKIFLTT